LGIEIEYPLGYTSSGDTLFRDTGTNSPEITYPLIIALQIMISLLGKRCRYAVPARTVTKSPARYYLPFVHACFCNWYKAKEFRQIKSNSLQVLTPAHSKTGFLSTCSSCWHWSETD